MDFDPEHLNTLHSEFDKFKAMTWKLKSLADSMQQLMSEANAHLFDHVDWIMVSRYNYTLLPCGQFQVSDKVAKRMRNTPTRKLVMKIMEDEDGEDSQKKIALILSLYIRHLKSWFPKLWFAPE